MFPVLLPVFPENEVKTQKKPKHFTQTPHISGIV